MKYGWIGFVLVGCASAAHGVESAAPEALTCAGEAASDPSVVRVFFSGGMCTGVLVSDSEVMTAAHCVHGDMQVEIGDVHYLAAKRWAWGARGEDVAMLALSAPLPDAQPASVAAVAPRPGDALTLIGYGCTGKQLSRSVTRRWGAYAEDTEYDADGCTCPGDSGGPVFNADGELVAINWARGKPALVDVTQVK